MSNRLDYIVESLTETINGMWSKEGYEPNSYMLEDDLEELKELASLARLGLKNKTAFDVDKAELAIADSINALHDDNKLLLTDDNREKELSNLRELGRLAKLALENGLE